MELQHEQSRQTRQPFACLTPRWNSRPAFNRRITERELREIEPDASIRLRGYLESMSPIHRRLPFVSLLGALGCLVLWNDARIVALLPAVLAAGYVWKQSRKTATRLLPDLEDIRSVGSLVEALEHADERTCREIEDALIRLLPQLHAGDVSLLDRRQREILYQAMNGGNVLLLHAILKAFEQIGDRHALPHVQRLTFAQAPAIQESARACLRSLQKRVEQAQFRQNLLHPSCLTSVASDRTLLRSVTGDFHHETPYLLRASSKRSE